jgi:hypothetical protein
MHVCPPSGASIVQADALAVDFKRVAVDMGVAFLSDVPISEEEAWAWSWKISRENRLVAVHR